MKIKKLEIPQEGGCSAKFSPTDLTELLKNIPVLNHNDLLVGKDGFDDAVVWRLNEHQAIVQTTDFFPVLCDDPYRFGQIAAANAISDIFAMGAKPIFALNLVMFPPEEEMRNSLMEMLRGGGDKIAEAGAVLAGGHTIKDSNTKYGLAVTGTVSTDKIITNSRALTGEKIILTKALGTGIILSGKKIDEVMEETYQAVLDSMAQLNNIIDIFDKFNIKCATDITGFGLVGHCVEVAEASKKTLRIQSSSIPVFNEVERLLTIGCIPCAAFKNLECFEEKTKFSPDLPYNLKMLCFDAQTSGGILLTCNPSDAKNIINELHDCGFGNSAVIGEVFDSIEDKPIILE